MITVLVSAREDAASGRTVRSRGDSVAVGLALGLVGADAVRLVSASHLPETVARDYLALGARRIDIVPCSPPQDPTPWLAQAVATSKLVLTGSRTETGLGSGALPYALANALTRPVIADVVAVSKDGEAWLVTQALPKGARRRLRISVPAVLAIHPSAPVTLRHSYRDQLAGQVHRQAAPAEDTAASPWQFVPAARQLQRLQAARAQSGHSRMLGAIATEAASSAGTVLTDGSAQDKARAVFAFLKQHALLSF